MDNQFEYTGKPNKPRAQQAYNLYDMNAEDRIRMDKENVKELIKRETVYAAAAAGPFGLPGVVAGTALGYIDSEVNKKKRLKAYGVEQSEIGSAINDAMREL